MPTQTSILRSPTRASIWETVDGVALPGKLAFLVLEMQNGKITCRYDDNCSIADNRGALRMVEELNANNRINPSSSNHKPSQTATPKMLVHPQQQHHHLPHRTAAINSLSKTANRPGRNNKAMPTDATMAGDATSTSTATTFERSTISSKQHFNHASDETSIARTFAIGWSKINADFGAEPADPQYAAGSITVPEATSGAGHFTKAGAPSGDENILLTAPAKTNHLQHNPDNGGFTIEAEGGSSSRKQQAPNTVATTPQTPATNTHKKRSLLQMFPIFDSISDLDGDLVAPTRRNTKRSERG